MTDCQLCVTGTLPLYALYPDFETESVYVSEESPLQNTCPGGVHDEVNVTETSFTVGVTVFDSVLKKSL